MSQESGSVIYLDVWQLEVPKIVLQRTDLISFNLFSAIAQTKIKALLSNFNFVHQLLVYTFPTFFLCYKFEIFGFIGFYVIYLFYSFIGFYFIIL